VRPPFSQLLASACGRWLLATTPTSTHLVDLAAAAYHGRVPLTPADGPVTAAAFAPDGATLALATTEHKLALFDCATLAPAVWLRQRADVALKLGTLPGFVTGISFRPGSCDDLLLHSHGATCHVSLGALRDSGAAAPGERKKRHRGRHKPAVVGDARGAAVRVMPQHGVCLGAAFVSASAAVLVEADWAGVLQQLPPPMALRVYGQ